MTESLEQIVEVCWEDAERHINIWASDREELVRAEFARRLVAELTKGQEPVAFGIPGFEANMNGWIDCRMDKSGEFTAPLYAAPIPSTCQEPALSQYKRMMREGEEKSPLERLRFFCSLAMNGQDWIDVEPFFDAIEAERGDYKARALLYERTNAEQAAMLNQVISERDGLAAKHEVACGTIKQQRADIDTIRGYMDALKGSCERMAQQRGELLEALHLCKFDSLNMSMEDLGFIRAVVAKVQP